MSQAEEPEDKYLGDTVSCELTACTIVFFVRSCVFCVRPGNRRGESTATFTRIPASVSGCCSQMPKRLTVAVPQIVPSQRLQPLHQ